MSFFRLFLLHAILILSISKTYALDPRVVQKNNSAMKNLTRDENATLSRDSYRELLEALSVDPLNPVLRQNLGILYLVNKDEAKALAEFKFAAELSPDDSDIKFESLFNSAVVLGKMGEIDSALNYYQNALKIKPDSLEVKKNIELLLNNQGQGQSQSQNQSGQGNQDQQDQNQNGNQDQNQKNPQANGEQEQKQNKGPKPFESKELTKEDVRRILEELKNQEQKIRADILSKGPKEKANGKDW